MELPKRPNFTEYEPRIYQEWEKAGVFTPRIDPKKKPYTILLPPPNANADLHAGHAMFVIEDILIRFHRMLGDATLWIPGTDHAGFETQYVYENILAEEGKSRFDFDRETLYQKIYQFVQENSGRIQKQLRRLGFSLDWTRETFMLEDRVVKTVLETFKKMHDDGLVYRDNYMVNYCPFYGTTFSDLEIKYIEQKDPLYFIKYGPFELATVRPETKFGDTAVAVHPDDQRYQQWIGKEIEVEGLIGNFKLKVIADEVVDPEFGTGVVKITPAHDPDDFEVGKRHGLEIKQAIGFDGKLTDITGPYTGLTVNEARPKVVQDLKEKGLLSKVDENYTHRVAVSYKGNQPIEPMIMPNWFVDAQKMAIPAIKAAKEKRVQFIPKRFENLYYQWMENIKPWAISRQIAFGIRIPAWYNIDENPNITITFLTKERKTVTGKISDLLENYSLDEIESGLQSLSAPIKASYKISLDKPGERFLRETDVFDTWFSSGQWPLTTLGYPDSKDFKYFYPTSVLDTMWDIIFFWVARMIMFGIYLTNAVPFKTVYLHSMVTDEKGQKMSKSKGNVINPLELVEESSADALRMSLVVGSAPGNPIALSESKVKGYRNFVTKLWNIARFVLRQNGNIKCQISNVKTTSDVVKATVKNLKLRKEDQEILQKLNALIDKVTKSLDNFRFSQAGEAIYDFIWHELADKYIEAIKPRLYSQNPNNNLKSGISNLELREPETEDKQTAIWVLNTVLINCLKLLHPFMPFVTEEIYQKLPNKETDFIAISPWPQKIQL